MIGDRGTSRTYPRRSLHAHVTHELGAGIISGRFKSGSLLPKESDLGSQLEVSRTALREAVKVLAGKGLLETRPKVGTRVRPRAYWNMLDPDVLAWHFEAAPDEDLLNSLFEVRHSIEPAGAALAAMRAGPRQIAEIRAAYDAMERAPGASEAAVRADLRFHQGILAATGNPFIGSLGSVIETALAASFRLSDSVHPEGHVIALPGHLAVLETIEAGLPDLARAAMEALLEDAHDKVRRALNRRRRVQPNGKGV